MQLTKIVILGSRGVPNRYGGFEALAENLQRTLHAHDVHVIVLGNWDPIVKYSRVGRLTSLRMFRSLETPLRTWSARKLVDPDQYVLVVNPVNVLSAIYLTPSVKKVLLHMDGLEHKRDKWGVIARTTHQIARFIALNSNLNLISDSKVIKNWYHTTYKRETLFLPYGGCYIAESNSDHRWKISEVDNFYLVVARPEPENQVIEICESFLESNSPWKLKVLSTPMHSNRYWARLNSKMKSESRVQLLDFTYDRPSLCKLYLKTRGVIHGHTVGGTNPSLVDALSHGCPVFAHANPYNQEVLGADVPTWKNVKELTKFFNSDLTPVSAVDPAEIMVRYNWTNVADGYLKAFGLK